MTNSFRLLSLRDDLPALLQLRARRFPNNRRWLQFLNSEESSDVAAWSTVANGLSSTSRDLSAPISRPLLLLFLCGATSCCDHVTAELSLDQLDGSRETAGNVLHALVLGLRASLRPRENYESLFDILLRRFGRSGVRRLGECCGHLGLRPAELAAKLEEFDFAERILTSGALSIVQQQVRGPNLLVTFELGPYDSTAEETRYLQSPIAFLSELESREELKRVKESKILRPDSLFNVWITSLYDQNIQFLWPFSIVSLITCLISAITGNSFSRKTIARACGETLDEPICWSEMMMEILVYILLIVINSTYGLVALVFPLFLLISRMPIRSLLKMILENSKCYFPNFLCLIAAFIWMRAVTFPTEFCSKHMQQVHAVATAVVGIIFLIMSFYSSMLAPIVGKFLRNFFAVLNRFIVFLLFYLLMILVFASSFQILYFNARTDNKTTHAQHVRRTVPELS